jgi:hypothetical protein
MPQKKGPAEAGSLDGAKDILPMKTVTSLRVARKPNTRPSLVHPKPDSIALRLRWLVRNPRLSETHASLVAELAFSQGRAA